jgi:hypothetical protein
MMSKKQLNRPKPCPILRSGQREPNTGFSFGP